MKRVLYVLGLLLAFNLPSFSQAIDGVITGRVEDITGGFVPGVKILLTSTAIQGERTLVTDESGSYRFRALPPGTYTVRYELRGFKTLVREGIVVEVGRTVTLNVRLEVASYEETVTVMGETPLVDVEQARIGVNFSSVLKDNIANARNYWSLLSVTPGVKTTTADVGGSTMGTQVGYRAYGMSGQVKIYLDGVDLTEDNASGSLYGDYGSWEEVQVAAAGNSAEMGAAGASVVAVIRSGGNNFSGKMLLSYENDGFQSKNIADRLRNQGITVGDRFSRYTDFNADLGGPIKRDKFWFYGSFRNEYSGLNTEMRQNDGKRYVLPESGVAPSLCSQLPCVGDNPDGAARGGLFYTRVTNGTTKLTYQINQRNQFSASTNVRLKLQPYRNGQGTNARNYTPETTQRQESWFHTVKAQWTSTLSNRMTLDVSVNNFGYYWVNRSNVQAPRIVDDGTSGPTRGFIQGGYIHDLNNNRRWHENIVLSRFFDKWGSHNLGTGYTLQWEDYRGSTRGYAGHILYRFLNGVPDRINVYNTPIQWEQYGLLLNYFYVQDKWQIRRRLTLNMGFRFDRFSSHLPRQVRESAGGNPFSNATDIVGLETFGNKIWEKRSVAVFNMPVPRVSLVYDLFGNGRTAIKASYGLFAYNPSFNLAEEASDNVVRNAVYSWNGTMPVTPEYLRSCLRGGGCRIISQPNLTQTRIDPGIKDGRISEYTAGLDQQLFGDWNLRFSFIRKIVHGSYGSIDQAYKLTDYAPIQFRNPGRDGAAGTADDSIVTAYNRAVATRPADPLVTYRAGAGSMYRTYEIQAVKRLSNRWQLVAGGDWTKRDLAAELFTNNPNTFITQSVFPASHYWEWTGKLVTTVDLPLGFRYNSTVKSQKGEPSSRTISVNCDRVVAPGQTCSQAGGRAPTQGTFNLTVEQSGSGDNHYPTLTLWDMGVERVFNFERLGRIEAMFELFNVLNANTVTGWSNTSSSTRNLDGTTVTTFRRPSRVLNPRIFRLGLRWRF